MTWTLRRGAADQPVETLVERLSARDEDINRDGFR